MTDDVLSPSPLIRPRDWSIAVGVTLFYLLVWVLTPEQWGPLPASGKWFLLLFAPMAGAGAMLASHFFTTRGLRSRDCPAVWLAIQVIFWNPLAFCAVVALAGAVGIPPNFGPLVALVGLLLLGVPTSLLGCALSGSPAWIATYAARSLQCLSTGIPLFPPLLFLHVVVLAQAVTWERYVRLNGLAVSLLIAEQTAALLWFYLFSGFKFAADAA